MIEILRESLRESLIPLFHWYHKSPIIQRLVDMQQSKYKILLCLKENFISVLLVVLTTATVILLFVFLVVSTVTIPSSSVFLYVEFSDDWNWISDIFMCFTMFPCCSAVTTFWELFSVTFWRTESKVDLSFWYL